MLGRSRYMFAACAPAPSVEILNACTHLLVFTALLGLKVTFRIKPTVKGLLRWCDSVGQYGIKVSFWGSGTPSNKYREILVS